MLRQYAVLAMLASPAADPTADDDAPPQDAADADETFEDGDQVRTVVVTATRTERSQEDSAVATQVYGREEIEESGAENLAEILEETPGVQLTRGIGGVGISLQGLDPSYTTILVDGMRTTGRVNNVMDLSRFPAEEIEQIEVVRGPSSVLYGADALAGTVNLISRRPKKRHEGEAHFAYGSFGTIDLSGRVGGTRKWYSGSAVVGWHRTDGFDLDPSDVSTDGPQSNQWNVQTTQEFGSFGPFKLGARAGYLRRDALLVDATNTGAVFDRSNRSEVITAALTPEFEFDHSRLRIMGSYNLWRDQFLNDQRGSSDLDTSQDTFDHIGQVMVQYDLDVKRHTITVGADTQFEVLSTDRIDPPSVDRQRYAVFIQDEWTPTDSPRIVVLPGVRLDYDTFFGVYPTPRIALMLRPTRKWTFRASYGRGFRAPSFREMFLLFANPGVGYTVRGNPELQPETSWSASLSAEYRPWRWLWLASNVFDNRLQDTIVTDTADPDDVDTATLFEYTNIGEATSRGVENQASIAVLEMLRLEGSYTFVHTRNHATGRPLPGRARHFGTAGFRFYRDSWGTGLRVRSSILGARSFFIDTDDDDVEEELRSDPFATFDARLSQRFMQYVQVFVGVDNILDAGNPTDNPLQPRTYYGGVTIRY